MFCPKCAAKNEFCRSCGQNIDGVARVLMGHGSVAMATKLDALFDRPNEALLRDGVVWIVIGVLSLAFVLFKSTNAFQYLLPFLGFSFGSWSLIQYQHSITTNARMSEPKPLITEVFCPTCGKSNEIASSYCLDCGTQLDVIKALISDPKPGSFIRFLKSRFGWLAVDINTSTWTRLGKKSSFKTDVRAPLILCLLLIVFGVVNFGLSRDLFSLISNLAIALPLLIVGCWNYISGRRSGFDESEPGGIRVFGEFYADLFEIMIRHKRKIIKAAVIIWAISAIVVGVIWGSLYWAGMGLVIAFFFTFFGSLYVIQLMLFTMPLLSLAYFPSFLYLNEIDDRQRSEKKKIVLVTGVTMIICSSAINWVFGNSESTSAGLLIVMTVTVSIRLLQFLTLQLGLVPRHPDVPDSAAEAERQAWLTQKENEAADHTGLQSATHKIKPFRRRI